MYLNKFGSDEGNVGIIFGGSDTSICLLVGSSEDLFQLVPSLDDPSLRAEERHLVRGFGARLLENEPDSSAIIESGVCSSERQRSIDSETTAGSPQLTL
jgi:hypothetical protein